MWKCQPKCKFDDLKDMCFSCCFLGLDSFFYEGKECYFWKECEVVAESRHWFQRRKVEIKALPFQSSRSQ